MTCITTGELLTILGSETLNVSEVGVNNPCLGDHRHLREEAYLQNHPPLHLFYQKQGHQE